MKSYFAQNLKYLRKISGLTLEELSKKTGASVAAIHYWETGQREPAAVEVYCVANLFNISIDDIIKKNLLNSSQKITSNEFANEVLPLIDKVSNLTDNQKDFLKQNVKFVCEDK